MFETNIDSFETSCIHCILNVFDHNVNKFVKICIHFFSWTKVKPEVQSSTPSLNRVTEGNSALLECSLVAANPSTSIKWKWFRAENYNVVLYTESTYTISDVQRNMSGPYSCTASNSVGTSEAVTVNVDVECKKVCLIECIFLEHEK